MEKPWYRHFWVWFMLAPLIGTVIASVVTLFLAGGEPALVVDEFDPIAMAVERDQQRDRRAAEMGITARLRFSQSPIAGGQAVAIGLTGAAPDRLKLELIHPTLERADQRVILERSGDNYAGTVPRADTRLYVMITDGAGAWRLTGVLDRHMETLALAAGR